LEPLAVLRRRLLPPLLLLPLRDLGAEPFPERFVAVGVRSVAAAVRLGAAAVRLVDFVRPPDFVRAPDDFCDF